MILGVSFFFLLLSLPLFAHAQGTLTYTLLEPIQGFFPASASTSLNQYLVGLFRFAIAVSGVLSVIMITWCGFNLLTSTNPSAREEAKKCIQTTLLGLFLAIGSFMILNTFQGSVGGIGLGAGGALPPLPTSSGGVGPGGGGQVGGAGTPLCTITSSNTTLQPGQSTNISANCTQSPASYLWTSSGNAPQISGVGGNVTFPTAGIYTFTVTGVNAVGTGLASQTFTISVGNQAPVICAAQTPQPVQSPIGCAQTNTAYDWNPMGPGQQQQNFQMGNRESVSIAFTTVGTGGYGSFSVQGILNPNTGAPMNTNTEKFVNISSTMCDFRYNNIDTNECGVSGSSATLYFQIGQGNPPGNPIGCVLAPNTGYVINIRNEAAGGPFQNRGVDTCAPLQTCEFEGILTQSQGAQFVPTTNPICIPVVLPTQPPPTLTILSPQNGATFPSGDFPVQFSAQDTVDLLRVSFNVINVQTGRTVVATTSCSDTGALNVVIDPNTGQVISTSTISGGVPACGAQISRTQNFSFNAPNGQYRIEGIACNTNGQCVRQNTTITVTLACVTVPNVRECYAYPPSSYNTLPAVAQICADPINGSSLRQGWYDHDFAENSPNNYINERHAHRFRLGPNQRARIIVANNPLRLDSVNNTSGNTASQCVDYQNINSTCNGSNGSAQCGASNPYVPSTGWCTGDGLLGDSWVSGNRTCTFARARLRVGQLRSDPTLRVGISSTPFDISATNQTSLSLGGNAYGDCGTSEDFAISRYETIVKTFGQPGPGECVILPNTDYYMSVMTLYPITRPVNQRRDRYGTVLSVLP